jgi:hypothetical protein
MLDTTICTFCESGDHEHPAYSPEVCKCGCRCHGLTPAVGLVDLVFNPGKLGVLPIENPVHC